MSEEVVAEVTPAPELEATAAPEPVVETQAPESAPKTFTQEELDAAIGKRLAREQRKWEREQQAKQVAPAVPTEVPTAEQFDSPQAYADFIRAEAQKLVQQQEFQKQQAAIVEAYHDKEEEARSKYDDFEQVAYNPNLRITDVMAETIRASDVGPDVAYYLGANPKEADRISRMAPILQAKEIGKIEAKLATEPPVKKTSSAPAPFQPVTARSVGSPAYDTTDPRSVKTMSTSDWIAADRARQMKKLEAQRLR
jgi:hypothetical protein